RAEIFRLDEIESGSGDAREQLCDGIMVECRRGPVGEKAAAPVIAQERLRESARPHVDAAVADGGKLHPFAGERSESARERVGVSGVPVEKDVHTQRLFAKGTPRRLCLTLRTLARAVPSRLELLRPAAEPPDPGLPA